MSKSTPKQYEVHVGRSINTQHVVWLTDAQADARAHCLKLDEQAKPRGPQSDKRQRYEITQPIYFKPGEQLMFEGKLDRGLETMFGLSREGEDPTPAQGGGDDQGRAIEDAEKLVADAQAELAEAEKVLAEAEPDAKPDAGKAVGAAKTKLNLAEKALAELKGAGK